eukprot:3376926-Rhodomonas_salina.2
MRNSSNETNPSPASSSSSPCHGDGSVTDAISRPHCKLAKEKRGKRNTKHLAKEKRSKRNTKQSSVVHLVSLCNQGPDLFFANLLPAELEHFSRHLHDRGQTTMTSKGGRGKSGRRRVQRRRTAMV